MPWPKTETGREGARRANKKWREKVGRDVVREVERRWRKNNPEKQSEKNWRQALKRKYGLTAVRYYEMFVEQNGACAVCRNEQPDKRLAVDHDHRTGKIRALLCDDCNKKIGFLECEKRPMLDQYLLHWGMKHTLIGMPMMPGQSQPGGRQFG